MIEWIPPALRSSANLSSNGRSSPLERADPLNNQIQITNAERADLARWIADGAPIH